jgi:tricorn protease
VSLVLTTLALFATMTLNAFAAPEELPIIRDVHYPDLSPDASQIAFEYQGDIWVAKVDDGIARRLTVSDAYDHRPRFSPDGKMIAFVSDRYGNTDLFVMPAEGGTIQRVTFNSANDSLADWSPDGKKLLFTAGGRDNEYASVYEVEIDGGYVRPLIRDCCSDSATGYSPDGKWVTGIRRGGPWWRKGGGSSGNSEVMIYDIAADTMKVITQNPAMDNWPLFSADGSGIFFVSERGDRRPNVYRMKADGSDVTPVTTHDQDAVTFLTGSGDGKWLVYEWNFDVWILRSDGGTPKKVTLRAPIDYLSTFESDEVVTSGIEEMEVNRDGSLVAIRLKNDIFFVKPELKDDSIRVTTWPGPDGDYFWSPDGKQLAYISQEGGVSDVWVVDAETRAKRMLVHEPGFYCDMVRYSRDGKQLYFRHNAGGDGVFAADSATGKVTKLLPDADVEDLAVSPDDRWVMAQIDDAKSGRDLFIRPLEGGEWVNVTRNSDGAWGCFWSPDGKRIYFISRRDGNSEIYSIDLQRQPVEFDDYEQQLADKEKEKPKPPEPPKPPAASEQPSPGEKPAEGKEPPKEGEKVKPEGFKPPTAAPIDIDFQRIDERAKRLTNSPDNEGIIAVAPDAKAVYFTRGNEIWAMDAEGDNQRRIAGAGGGLGPARMEDDGRLIFFVDGGRLKKVLVNPGPPPQDISWKAKIRTDQRLVQKEALRQAWALLDEQFYSYNLHGTDWNAIWKHYSPMCNGTLAKDDFHHLVSRMIGELNASHLGVYGGPGPSGPSTARLGIVADPRHRGPGIKVGEIMPDGPADQPNSKIGVGEYIMSLDGEEVADTEHFSDLLNGREGERVKLTVNTEPKREGERAISIKPISGGTYDELDYQRWVRDNRALVTRLSKGRVYYAHIRGMDDASAVKFQRELAGEAQHCEALLVDVRNNGGGYTHDRILEMLTKKVHGFQATRGLPLRPTPVAQFSGPKALLINEYSASDAEIFPNGFRQKGLGPLIGMPTSGAVIGTYDTTLVNGSRFRVPVNGWFTMEGVDLENMGVKPDYEVPFPYEAYRDHDDPQIRKAVAVLLEALEKQKPAQPPEIPH